MTRRFRPGWKGLFYGGLLPALARLRPDRAERLLRFSGRWLARRRGIARAVEEARAALGADWNVPAVCRELAESLPLFLARDTLLEPLDDHALADRFEVSGLDHLADARHGRRGVVLLGCHYGAHVAALHWLARQELPLRILAQRPSHASRQLLERFDSDHAPFAQTSLTLRRGLSPASSARRVLLARDALRAGYAVYLNGDVVYDQPGARLTPFLGRERPLVTVWADLAHSAGARVLSVFCVPTGAGRFRLEIQPLETAAAGGTDGYVPNYLRELEDRIRHRPAAGHAYFGTRRALKSWCHPTD